MELLGYISSILMGLSLGLIGGGGSILTVPILVYLFGLQPSQATGYSLFIVGLTALVGSFAYIRKGEIDYKTGFIFAAPSFLGVYAARAFIVPALPSEIATIGSVNITKNLLIMGVFAVLMVVASYSMIKEKKAESKKKELAPAIRVFVIALEGLVVGGITGFVGAGGGFLIIPALVLLTGLPMRVAVGTSLMIIAIKSLLGFTGDIKHATEAIDWSFLLTISGIAVVGILVGSMLTKYISERKLKKSFGWFVLLMGSAILIEQISRM